MQSPTPEPARDETPFATPLPATDRTPPPAESPQSRDTESPGSPESSHASARELLVPRAARRIAALLTDLKRKLEAEDAHALVEVHGKLVLQIRTPAGPSQYTLGAASHPAEGISIVVEAGGTPVIGEVAPVNARAASVDEEGTSANAHPTSVDGEGANSTAPSKRTRRDSDAELEKELVSRKRQRLDGSAHVASNHQHAAAADEEEEEEDVIPLITKEDLESIVAKLRDDIQEDTSECVNHVQKLLRRFKEEWHKKSTWDFEQVSDSRTGRAARHSIAANGTAAPTAFPSPGADQDDQDITVPDLVRQESKLLSSQIKWVEECRRVAADAHDKREENWRTSSASFHDKARQDRESFQGRILYETGMQSQTLQQILNEVKAFGLYVQSMKWETPSSMSTGPAYHQGPVAPAFPTQPTPAPSRGRGRGRPRGA